MVFIVYKTTCLINNKVYIGVHRTKDKCLFDGYIGNGVNINSPSSYKNANTAFKKAVIKYGINNFTRKILRVFHNEQEAYEYERIIVNEDFVKSKNTYNMIIGGRQYRYKSIPPKRVYMYSLDGIYVRSFNSLNEAARFVNKNTVTSGHLKRSISKHHQYHGYQFSYEKKDCLSKIKTLKNHVSISIPYEKGNVGMFDKDMNLVQKFETMTDCVKAGYKNAKLVALGKRKYCLGFIFKYLN